MHGRVQRLGPARIRFGSRFDVMLRYIYIVIYENMISYIYVRARALGEQIKQFRVPRRLGKWQAIIEHGDI